ncbi:hypothetical protein GQ600_8166 [Phytophthora cactorum]|nr:hypothetical protein GQ600_8166 [Phytophthora cactorum]
MVVSTKSFFAMLAMTALAAGVNGHGYMTEPAVTFLSSSTDNTQFIATIESSCRDSAALSRAHRQTIRPPSPLPSRQLVHVVERADQLLGYDYRHRRTLTCGSCDPDETAQPLPETYVEWSHSSTEGFHFLSRRPV